MRQTRRLTQVSRLAQPVIQAPAQAGRAERRLLRQLPQAQAREVPDELGRQLHLQLHGNALLARQLQGQPAPHALARHHHQRRGEGVMHGGGEQGGGQLAKGFQVRGVIKRQHQRESLPFSSGQGYQLTQPGGIARQAVSRAGAQRQPQLKLNTGSALLHDGPL